VPSTVQLLDGRVMLVLRRTLKLAPDVLVKENWNEMIENQISLRRFITEHG